MPDESIVSSRRDLTEIKGFEPVLPELGKIKIGEKGQLRKSKSGTSFQAPQKLDHFKVTGLERGPDNNLLVDLELHKVIGKNPRELDIVFPYNELDLNFVTFFAWYSSRTVRCKGNGQVAFRLDENSGEYKQIECNPEKCPMHSPPPPRNKKEKPTSAVCKPNGILSVILMKAPRIGGVYKFRTTSYNTVRNVRSSLMMIRQLTGGTLAGIPLKLTLKPQTVNPKGMQGSIVVYTVSVEWVGTLEGLFQKALESAQMRAQNLTDIRSFEEQARKALTTGPVETEAEAREVAEEFYPDAVIEDAEIIDVDPVEEGKAQAENPAQDAQGSAQEANEGMTDNVPSEPDGDPRAGDEPPVEVYAEDLPPDIDGDLLDDVAPGVPGEDDAPAEDESQKTEGGNNPTNTKSRRRI